MTRPMTRAEVHDAAVLARIGEGLAAFELTVQSTEDTLVRAVWNLTKADVLRWIAGLRGDLHHAIEHLEGGPTRR